MSIGYELAQRKLRAEENWDGLRGLYRLTGDKAAEAAMDREIMGQPAQIQTDR